MTDLFKGNAKRIEMSRYIDLDIYHAVEKTHPFYMEMIGEIHNNIESLTSRCKEAALLELGAGTGLLTEELIRHKNLIIDALDVDHPICEILEKHVGSKIRKVLCEDAVTFCNKEPYDLVVSTFAHDHINFEQGPRFIANIRKNLKKGGHYIMGGEILPHFSDEKQRQEALYTYHGYIVNKALRERHFLLAQIEINALQSGLDLIGDFKRHEEMFEKEMLSANFKLKKKMKMGPLDLNNVGGVFVYVYEAL